ncbi:hypothetical protein LTV02_27135 [Nocardia yamanashiensis]|uniref:hypothetical protein n=1 Tax=Nocardia yamanashiensis TaxID=209247 RepID=UPI001E387E3B|nr:hypothetical protein [Nocardia yamanashiensis]UGT39716.1 hypothetical protein LTV02_27135 [Nocardia yamanashiensis]
MTRDYTDFPGLSGLYLQDSYVVDIVEKKPGEFEFVLEAVLLREHPAYRSPVAGEQHCYADGALIFTEVTAVDWLHRSSRRYKDATGTEDLGNIDSLTNSDGVYSVAGDWGKVLITSSVDPRFEFTDSRG